MALSRSTGVGASAMLLAVALSLSACSGNDTKAGSDGGGSLALAGFGVQQSSSLSFPELEAGARAALESINAKGGINGHKLTLHYCNDGGDPNKAATCARDIASSKAVAVVGSLTFGGAQALPIFEAADLADIAPLPIVSTDFNSKNVFLVDGGGVAVYQAMPETMKQVTGAKKLAVLYGDNAAAAQNKKLIAAGIAATGQTIVKELTVPANSVDVSTYLNEVKASGADAVLSLLPAQDQIKVWQAAKSVGLDIPMVNSAGGAPLQAVKAAGAAAEGTFVTSQFPNPTGDDPGLADFQADMAKYAPDAAVDTVSLRAWAGVQLFAKVASTIHGDITRQSVLKALNETKDLPFYWVGKISFDQPGPLADYKRVVVPMSYPLQIEGGKYKDVGKPINLSAN